MLMNTINKFEQPNTEQADRRCAFSRSFTRMFDRLCAFLDERIGGASAARIDACQSVADRFWHSKLYFPVCFLMLAVFMAVGQPVIGGVLVMSTLIFLLLFCDDLLSILFPVVLLAMVGTEFYDELYSLLRFWWIGLLAAAALLVHIGAYARAPRNGGCLHGHGGRVGRDAARRPRFYLPRGVLLAHGTVLFPRSRCRDAAGLCAAAAARRTAHATMTLPSACCRSSTPVACSRALWSRCFMCATFQEFLQNFATIYFKYRNFSATMLLIAIPAAAYFAAHDRRHFAVGRVFVSSCCS